MSIENNIVVNNVLTLDNIEKRTKKKVVALEEKAVDNPDAASKADSNSVAIFIPVVKEEPNARPKKIAEDRRGRKGARGERHSGAEATRTDCHDY